MKENFKPEFGTRETGMFVPEGFFEDFQKKLEQKIDEQESQKKIERRATIVPLRKWAIAASVCLLLGLAPVAWHIFFNNDAPVAPTGTAIETLAETETDDYDMNADEIMVSTISDLDIYEAFYANL